MPVQPIGSYHTSLLQKIIERTTQAIRDLHPKEKPWLIATLAATLYLFGLSMAWVLRDVAPPSWDDGLYLNQIMSHVEAVSSGPTEILWSILNIDPGRVPLGPILAVPLSVLLGPSEFAAVLTVNLFIFVASWNLFRIGQRFHSAEVGFWSVLLLGLLPVVQVTTHYYYIDYYVMAFVLWALHLILDGYQQPKKLRWLELGLVLGFGTLTKVTFPVFVIGPLLLLGMRYAYLAHTSKHIRLMYKPIAAALITLFVALPYILYNFAPLKEQSQFLNSPELAALYGMENPFKLSAFWRYLKAQFYSWLGIFVSLSALLGIVVWIMKLLQKRTEINTFHKLWLVGLLSCFLPAVLVFGFGYVQDNRYLMPALPILALLASYAWAQSNAQWLRLPIVVAVSVSSWIVISSSIFPLVFRTDNHLNSIQRFADYHSPDPKDWQVPETIQAIHNSLEAAEISNYSLQFLGGNRRYHLALFDYETRKLGYNLQYVPLPYYLHPDMTAEQAIGHILTQPLQAVLHKSGNHWPPFSSRNDVEIVSFFRSSPEQFQEIDLGITLPDDSRYSLFLIKDCLSNMKDHQNVQTLLDQPISFGNKYTLQGASLVHQPAWKELHLEWKLTPNADPPHETRFTHLLNENQEIVFQKDDILMDDCPVATTKNNKETTFVEIIMLSEAEISITKEIKIGIYQPHIPDSFLEVSPIQKLSEPVAYTFTISNK